MAQSILVTGTQRVPLEAELMMDDHFYVNTTTPTVRNVLLDVKQAENDLNSMLVLDAEKDLEVVEESPLVSITVFCQRWFQKAFNIKKEDTHRIELLKEVIVSAMEEANDDPIDYTELHTDVSTITCYEDGVPEQKLTRKTERRRITKGNRSKFSAALAQRVKVKFGTLRFSEANRIMVHRWLGSVVDEEYTDLRVSDKALALERATFMAFIVSEDFARFQVLFDHSLMKEKLLLRFGAEQ